MLWPLRGAADRIMSALAFLAAATPTMVMLAPTLTTALMAFGLPGVGNAKFFAAALAARSEYAPVRSRGQVFIWGARSRPPQDQPALRPPVPPSPKPHGHRSSW